MTEKTLRHFSFFLFCRPSVAIRGIAESPNELFTQFVVFFKQPTTVLVKQSFKLRSLL